MNNLHVATLLWRLKYGISTDLSAPYQMPSLLENSLNHIQIVGPDAIPSPSSVAFSIRWWLISLILQYGNDFLPQQVNTHTEMLASGHVYPSPCKDHSMWDRESSPTQPPCPFEWPKVLPPSLCKHKPYSPLEQLRQGKGEEGTGRMMRTGKAQVQTRSALKYPPGSTAGELQLSAFLGDKVMYIHPSVLCKQAVTPRVAPRQSICHSWAHPGLLLSLGDSSSCALGNKTNSSTLLYTPAQTAHQNQTRQVRRI